MNTDMKSGITVLVFGDAPHPRALAALPTLRADDATGIDEAASCSRRLAVAGSDADLAAVLSRLIRTDALDVEVAHVPPGPRSWLATRRAMSGAARRVPLIRDDTGTALVGAALWLPPQQGAALHGEAVVDDTTLFDGDVAGVRIEPTPELPGLRAAVLAGPGRGAAVLAGPRRRWVAGRAAQLGTTGALVMRDGTMGPRQVKRSTFYRHTTGWLRVG
jgi:hypothetical protein